MCQAILDIKAHAKAEGVEEGVEKGVLKILAELVSDDVLSLTEAADRAKMTVEEFCAKTGLTERN